MEIIVFSVLIGLSILCVVGWYAHIRMMISNKNKRAVCDRIKDLRRGARGIKKTP